MCEMFSESEKLQNNSTEWNFEVMYDRQIQQQWNKRRSRALQSIPTNIYNSHRDMWRINTAMNNNGKSNFPVS